MTSPARRRQVLSTAPLAERGCLYCLRTGGAFTSEEHLVPRSLGPDTDRFALPRGVVCDRCNRFLGKQVDAPFVDRFDMRLSRRLEGLRGRSGGVREVIGGRDVTARLDLNLDGATVTLLAARADEAPDGGLDIEIRPVQRDPPDIVARTIRALWKIALGAVYLSQGRDALRPEWDHLRHAVLGAPFKGFLLQRPFQAAVTRRLAVNVELSAPEDPTAVAFALGGVILAAPLAQGARVAKGEMRRAGWQVHSTEDRQPSAVLLRLESDAPRC